jgi:hypothetical protein
MRPHETRRYVWGSAGSAVDWLLLVEFDVDPDSLELSAAARKLTWGLDAGQRWFVTPAQSLPPRERRTGIQHQAELGPRFRGGDAPAGLGGAGGIGGLLAVHDPW